MHAAVPIAWIVARAAGLVALALLTLSTWLGLSMSTRLLGPRRQKSLFGWHRTLVWTGLSMLVLHAGALLFDPVMHFGLSAVTIPFAAPWRAGAVAAGVVTGWLSLMLAFSFRARRWIGQRGWRALHYASFAAFGLALVHAVMAGPGALAWIRAAPRAAPRGEARSATSAATGVGVPSRPWRARREGR